MTELRHVEVLHCLAGFALALQATLAVWVGLARHPNWKIRCAVLLFFIGAWFPIEGRDIIIFLLYQAAVIVGCLFACRAFRRLLAWRRRRKSRDENISEDLPRSQIRLKDLLVAMALAATAFAMARSASEDYPVQAWWQLHQPVAATSAIALLAAWVVWTLWRWWWRVLLLAALVGVVAFAAVDESWNRYHWILTEIDSITFSTDGYYDHYAVITYAVATFIMLIVWRSFAPRANAQQEQPWREKSRIRRWTTGAGRLAKWSLALIGAGLVSVIGFFYCGMALRYPFPARPDIDPNGYDLLASIGERFKRDLEIPLAGGDRVTDEDISEDVPIHLHADRISQFAAEHGEVVEEVRAALVYESYVPTDYTSFEDVGGQFSNFLSLARVLSALGSHEELQGRPGQAAQIYLDTMRLGQVQAADGLFIDLMVGFVVESMGRGPLRRVRDRLNRDQRQDVLSQLTASSDVYGTIDGYLCREKILVTNALPCRNRFPSVGNFFSDLFETHEDSIRTALSIRNAKHRLLITTLALDLYREDRGELPTSLSELVPDYLPEEPLDPFGSGPLNYRRIDQERYLLYSLGRNRTDDGGIVVSYEGEKLTPDEAQAALISRQDDIDVEEGDLFLDQEDWEYSNRLLTPEEVELAVELSTEKPLDVEEDELEEGELEEGEADEIDEAEAELDE